MSEGVLLVVHLHAVRSTPAEIGWVGGGGGRRGKGRSFLMRSVLFRSSWIYLIMNAFYSLNKYSVHIPVNKCSKYTNNCEWWRLISDLWIDHPLLESRKWTGESRGKLFLLKQYLRQLHPWSSPGQRPFFFQGLEFLFSFKESIIKSSEMLLNSIIFKSLFKNIQNYTKIGHYFIVVFSLSLSLSKWFLHLCV